MKSIKTLLVAIAVLVSSAAFSQPAAPVKVTTVEGITQYNLANGMKVLLFPDQSKATITVNITYLVGSRHEGYGETGMAHLLEHMVFKGSTNHKNIPQELTAHGARPNGTTWFDRTNYFETFSATDENLKWALDLESDRMVNSFIADSALRTEFSVVRNEFEMGENDPTGVLHERIMSTAYLWHNYGQSTIGSKEDIERVPIQNLQAFYRKYYQPDNAVLLVAGKIDEEKTLKLVNERFGVIPKPSRKLEEPHTVEPVQDGERFVELKRVGDIQVVACGYHVSSGSHEDYPSIELLADILTDEPSGRLYKALVETKKASSGFGFSYQLKDPGFMYFSYDVLKEKSLDDAKKTMLDILDNLDKNPVTQAEVDRAKNKFMKDFDQTYNNSNSVGLTLSEYIAQGDWRLWFLLRDRIEKVTAADVNRIAGKYLKPSNRTVGLFIPDTKPQRAEIPPAPDVTALVKDYKGKTALGEAEAFDPSPANIDARTKTGSVPGGAKYALLNKSTRGNSVNVQITLRIGTEQSLQNKTAIADLTADMLNKGTKSKTRQQIEDEFDKLKSNVSISGSGQSVNISIQTVKDNLVPTLKLVNEILRQPTFPSEEFDKLIQENLSAIEQQRSEPQAIASIMSQKILNPYNKSDFRYVMDFDEMTVAYKNAKLDDVKKFYSDFYQSSNATVGVVGAFDSTAVKNELTSMLANWTAPEKFARAKYSFNDVASKTEKINTPDKANANLMAGFNLNIRDDDPDYMSLIMGNYMLGGGFLNSRLATRIRQKEGISYGVGSWVSADPIDKTGSFGSYAIYNPDNAEKLIEAYKEELSRMLKDGFTADEFKDARSGYLQGQNVSRAQDRSLATKLSSNLFLNRTMKWDENNEKKISNMTVEQVNSAVKKWITPSKITYVQAGDFDRKKKSEEKIYPQK
jgi:zinc protease